MAPMLMPSHQAIGAIASRPEKEGVQGNRNGATPTRSKHPSQQRRILEALQQTTTIVISTVLRCVALHYNNYMTISVSSTVFAPDDPPQLGRARSTRIGRIAEIKT
ncbi:hypothetical protein J7T55_012029 [Diaporthe amygdali]|uniref:uncharacterized protein n=1 Tax=Phomopsis amygdali TaxID=1214568 RepID=UPI0022FE2133|nr:uncharacterized protein J7T55_012029 [Diaporthe amygdali]KAJ0123564.1 hypothetical protein J7T55_012029 [Diaporthe amygdali]